MKYEANPVIVDASVITFAVPDFSTGGQLLILDDGRRPIATPEMTSRYKAKPGDYFVTQSDGYEYLNPKDVFERKYSLVTDGGEKA